MEDDDRWNYASPHEVLDAMHADFERTVRLDTAIGHSRSRDEAETLRDEINTISSAWLERDEWQTHWRYLQRAYHEWTTEPRQLSAYLDRLILQAPLGEEHPPDDPTIDVLEFVSELDCRHREVARRRATQRFSGAVAYEASYARVGDTEARRIPATSWWQARHWLSEQVAALPDQQLRVEISCQEVQFGDQRVVMTAQRIRPTELLAELVRFDDLLNAWHEPRGLPWLDELRVDVLLEEYSTASAAAQNPWDVEHRFEHRLRADDLRDQIRDFAAHADIEDAPRRLAEADANLASTNPYAIEPLGRTWLDDLVDRAARRLRQHTDRGIAIEYPHPGDPASTIHAGYRDTSITTPWYAEEHLLLTSDGETWTQILPIGNYGSHHELVNALRQHAKDLRHVTEDVIAQQVPLASLAALRSHEDTLAQLTDDLGVCRQLRANVAAQRAHPITATPSRTTAPPLRSNAANETRDCATARRPHTPRTQPHRGRHL
ncbi:hypothetical protein ACFYTQ_36655 [Nocardia sp. NPDC004068]|uniref:hypothetical protein n=1 Tax=Nocardia sp. NPDC004068 TaxID=3364303 RepID=UPI0036CEDCF3